MVEIEGTTEGIGNIIVWALISVVGFFLMLAFMSYAPNAIPVSNTYRGWLPLIILIAYVFFVYVGYKKAKRGQLL